jgi:hypothetical protein
MRWTFSRWWVMVLYAKQIGFGVSARAYNIEERAAYGKACMPSYGQDIIIPVQMPGTTKDPRSSCMTCIRLSGPATCATIESSRACARVRRGVPSCRKQMISRLSIYHTWTFQSLTWKYASVPSRTTMLRILSRGTDIHNGSRYRYPQQSLHSGSGAC